MGPAPQPFLPLPSGIHCWGLTDTLESPLEPLCLQFVLSFRQVQAPPLRSPSNLLAGLLLMPLCHPFLSRDFSYTVGICAILTIPSPLKFLERGECFWLASCSPYVSQWLNPDNSLKSVQMNELMSGKLVNLWIFHFSAVSRSLYNSVGMEKSGKLIYYKKLQLVNCSN